MRTHEIESLREALQGRAEILFAILYGSAAEGDDYRAVDVAVFVDPQAVPEARQLYYGFALEDELRQIIAHPVDVRVVNKAPPAFRFNVIRGQPLVIHDKEAYYAFRERSWSEYLNLEPLYRAYFGEML